MLLIVATEIAFRRRQNRGAVDESETLLSVVKCNFGLKVSLSLFSLSREILFAQFALIRMGTAGDTGSVRIVNTELLDKYLIFSFYVTVTAIFLNYDLVEATP